MRRELERMLDEERESCNNIIIEARNLIEEYNEKKKEIMRKGEKIKELELELNNIE